MEHEFSVELKARKYVKNISLSDIAHDKVLFEGNLGALQELSLKEGDVLELSGINGILRMSVTCEQLQRALSRYIRRVKL